VHSALNTPDFNRLLIESLLSAQSLQGFELLARYLYLRLTARTMRLPSARTAHRVYCDVRGWERLSHSPISIEEAFVTDYKIQTVSTAKRPTASKWLGVMTKKTELLLL
jgi:hypothetical protein